MVYDLIIIGGGPAGAAAAVYAARKKIKSLIVFKEWGGQSIVSPEIQNFIGFVKISGWELAEKLKEHVKAYANDVLEFDEGSLVKKVSKKDNLFEVETDKGKKYLTRTVLVVSGASRRKLPAKNTEKFEGKGISYCASCDAALFKDKIVAVIGGGNAGFEAVLQLLDYAKRIYLLEYTENFKADLVTQEKVLVNPKVIPMKMVEVLEVLGEKFVEGLIYLDRKTQEKKEIKLDGIFVEIGSKPNSDFVKDLVKLNEYGEIIIDHKNCRTSQEGIWAAGDVTDQPYKQNNISIGDAIKAVEDIYLWLKK